MNKQTEILRKNEDVVGYLMKTFECGQLVDQKLKLP